MHLYLCRCSEGRAQRERLLPMHELLSSEFYAFYYQETDGQCIHSEAAAKILDDNILEYPDVLLGADDDERIFPKVQQLSEQPFLVVVETETGLELLQRNRNKTIMCSCTHGKQNCQHKVAYSKWEIEQTVDVMRDTENAEQQEQRTVKSNFTCISKQKIKVPLTPQQQELYRYLYVFL